MASKDQVIANFAKQTGKYTHGSRGREGSYNVWYSGRVLYSWGTHFPLAIRYHAEKDIPEGSEGFGCGVQYILNGDKYSVSTTQHQSACIHSLTGNVQIPFSALQEAWNWATGDVYSHMVSRAYDLAAELVHRPLESGFKIVAYRKDTWQHTHDEGKTWAPGYWQYFVDPPEALGSGIVCCGSVGCEWVGVALSDKDPSNLHRLGAVLFTIRGTSFLSSFDEQDRTNYFLCQVPGSPTSIEDAYEALVPEAVKTLPSREGVLRQGDWFFLPVSEDKDVLRVIKKLKDTTNTAKGYYRLGGKKGTHTVTKARESAEGLVFVRGMVRHSPTDGRRSEHRRLKLGDGKQWYVPVKNTSEAGWGARGNVD